jgi:hypothetical protein
MPSTNFSFALSKELANVGFDAEVLVIILFFACLVRKRGVKIMF